MRAGTARLHLFGEGLDLPEIFLQLDFRDEGALAPLAVSDAQVAEGLKCLASGHAAHAQTLGDYLFGREGPAGLELSRPNFLKEVLVDLEIEGNDAMAIEVERIHVTPQLSRQLG